MHCLFHDSADRESQAKSVQSRENEIYSLELRPYALHCHGEHDQTSTMTTASVEPKSVLRGIDDASFIHVRISSQFFLQPRDTLPLARQKPITSNENQKKTSKILMKTDYCEFNPIRLPENAPHRPNGQNSSSHRDENYVGGGSSTDDTEDSTDKTPKPKPGKLDLRQFDNITNAIGKLNVQTKKTPPDLSSKAQSKFKARPQPSQEVASDFGYFKSKKVKSKAKESSSMDESAAEGISKKSSEQLVIETQIKREDAKSSSVTKSTPSTSSSAVAVNSGKRITNPRQNHGRAVAPPQLPDGLLPSDGMKDDKPVHHQVIANEQGVDFSQSPIAQRLLKYSKDYKVSELNSPCESDNEQGPCLGSFRNPRLQKGPSSIDSSELINAKGAAIKQLNEILANKQPHGRFAGARQLPSRSSSFDRDQDQLNSTEINKKKEDKKDKDAKKDKKKLRDDEKSERKRQKEEERLRRQEKKLAAKKSKTGDASGTIDDDGIPLFIRRCIEFIEQEGLDAEGIYRVPGNRAHVDAFVQKFKENPDMSIVESDIPVNAVATALKDFLSKKWGPIIPLELMNELTALSNISDKANRVDAVKQLVKRLPLPNYNLLKYVFSHFVRVSLNHSLNSMDSKNLAICWWPTLLPLHFSDMVMFEQMRPHLEESVQTMIDQYEYIFQDDGSAS